MVSKNARIVERATHIEVGGVCGALSAPSSPAGSPGQVHEFIAPRHGRATTREFLQPQARRRLWCGWNIVARVRVRSSRETENLA